LVGNVDVDLIVDVEQAFTFQLTDCAAFCG